MTPFGTLSTSEFQRLTLHRVTQLRSTSGVIEQALKTHTSLMRNEFSDIAIALPRSVAAELAAHLEEEVDEVEGAFTQGIRAALLTLAWSTFEVDLDLLCQILAEQTSVRLRPNDLAGKGIVRSRNFLKKVLGVSFPDQSPVWDSIKRLNELRNVIVHRASRLIVSEDQNLRKFISTWPSITIENEQLRFSPAFLPATFDTVEAFWKELFALLVSGNEL
jgi:hypothetical protein